MKFQAYSLMAIIGIMTINCMNAGSADTIFQIGSFDRNYAEFAISNDLYQYNQMFPNDVLFHVGTDNPKTSWPFIHPGPSDAWAGSRPHPFAISFKLNESPKGLFTLRIGLVSAHGSGAPKLRVDINGLSDSIQIPNGTSDTALTDPSQGRPYNMDLRLSSDVFIRGENRITLTCYQGSWMLYDAIQLDNNPSAPEPRAIIENVSLKPTIRFVKRADGLKQIVELNAASSIGDAKCAGEYRIGTGKTEPIVIRTGLFGLASQEIEIDELSQPARMVVSVPFGDSIKTAECQVSPMKKWKLYVLPSVHVDIGYTDIQPNVIDVHNRNTSKALDLMCEYPDFKWNMEAAWATDNFLRMSSDDRRDEFIKRAKEGRIGCEVIYGNMLTGLLSNEEQFRTLYDAKRMSKEYRIPFNMAMSSDVPTQVWTTPTYLAQSGIKYFASGINTLGGDPFGVMPSRSPFYWEGPDGSKVLTWLALGYGQAWSLGLNSDISRAANNIEGFVAGYNRADYPYDAVLAFGGFPDNWTMDSSLADVTKQWNNTYEYPKVILCTGPEFFKYIESNYEGQIPVIRGDGGAHWEDGAGSTAYETAITRNAKESLVAAEKLYSIASINGGTAYPSADFALAWRNAILYDEHTWGAAGSISDPESYQTRRQWAYKRAFALRASESAANLQAGALDAFGETISADGDSYIVFNPHSWTSSGPVTVDGSVFCADNVPAIGYKLFPTDVVKPAIGGQFALSNVMENRWYRVEINPSTGAVSSLYDKELNRELLDGSAGYGANQYIYVTGDGASIADATKITDVLISRRDTAAAQEAIITASAYNTPSIKTAIILYNDIKRIDFNNEIDKTETYSKEAGYFAFPFKMANPVYNISIPNGVFSPNTDMLPGGRISWYTAQDFVSIHNSDLAITWSAADSPLITLEDISRYSYSAPAFPPLKPIENGHLFAYVFNNYWFTNYKASQGGRFQFRFSLTSAKNYSPAAAYKFGESFRTPMLAVKKSSSHAVEKSPSMSFFSVMPEAVIITSIKKAESGDGYIIRLLNVENRRLTASVSLPKTIRKAWVCNQMEDVESPLKVEDGSVSVDIGPNGLAALLVK